MRKNLFNVLCVLLGLNLMLSMCNRANAQIVSSSKADTWEAIDGLGRKLPDAQKAGKPRKDRFVGLFYFVWHGAHGYDKHMTTLPDEGVRPKSPEDVNSPYDILAY